jgi:hypothetical protein
MSVPMLAEDQQVSGSAELRQHSGRRARMHDWRDLGLGPVSLLRSEQVHQPPLLLLDLDHRVRQRLLGTGCGPAGDMTAMYRRQWNSSTVGLFLRETQGVAAGCAITDCEDDPVDDSRGSSLARVAAHGDHWAERVGHQPLADGTEQMCCEGALSLTAHHN